MEVILDINYWNWLVAGLIFIIIELFTWSVFFLWMGVSSLTVGILVYFFPALDWRIQFVLFAMLSIISIYLARRLFVTTNERNSLNNRANIHIGHIYTVAEVGDNYAKVYVDDSLWLAKGCEMKIGQKVKVIDTRSATLIVTAVTDKPD